LLMVGSLSVAVICCSLYWKFLAVFKIVKNFHVCGLLLYQYSRNSSWYREIPYKFATGILLLNSAEFWALSYCIRKIRN
jgi:hypothetical protein